MKLLLTLTVIAIAWLVVSNRNRQRQISASQPVPRLLANPEPQSSRVPRLAAYALIVFMILASGVFLYLQWRDEFRIVSVQVIDSQTGRSVSYEARRGDVEERQFKTLDGRIVNVAETERIEIGGDTPKQ